LLRIAAVCCGLVRIGAARGGGERGAGRRGSRYLSTFLPPAAEVRSRPTRPKAGKYGGFSFLTRPGSRPKPSQGVPQIPQKEAKATIELRRSTVRSASRSRGHTCKSLLARRCLTATLTSGFRAFWPLSASSSSNVGHLLEEQTLRDHVPHSRERKPKD